MRRALFIATIVPLLAVTVAAESASTPTQATRSLRVVTYNTHLISPIMRCAADFPDWQTWIATLGLSIVGDATELAECVAEAGDIAPEEAKIIAQRLLDADFDVVALNEVFDNRAKEILVDQLKGPYPYYVEWPIPADTIDLQPEDSGLMIFSKFAFVQLGSTQPLRGFPPVPYYHESVEFDDCAGVDCFADKGAAYVRVVVDPSAGDDGIYTVAFTHFQADGGNDAVRISQLEQTVALVQPAAQLGRAVIVGDLNVDGTDGVWDVAAGTPVGGGGEWTAFTQAAFNGAVRLVDAWAATMPEETDGATIASDSRYDYALTNANLNEAGCVQHMTIHDLGPSDHYGLGADLNLPAPHCDPRNAWQNPPFDVPIDAHPGETADVTRIRHPGSMQWFHVELPAEASQTVSVGVQPAFDPATGEGVRFDLYSPSDLTNPLPSHLAEVQLVPQLDMVATKYHTPREFYIRVFSPNRSWTGDYSLGIHPHTCQTREDACLLYANEKLSSSTMFVANWPHGPSDEAWFQIDVTDKPDSGAAQPLRIRLAEAAAQVFDVALLDKGNPAVSFTLDGHAEGVVGDGYEITGSTTATPGMYLRVRRTHLGTGSPLAVWWESPLTRLHGADLVPSASPTVLECVDETNGIGGNEMGEDEIHLQMSVDGQGWKQVFGANYDCNNQAMEKDVPVTVRFLENVRIRVVEGDGDGNGDDASVALEAPSLSPEEALASSDPYPRVTSDHKWWKWEGGHYKFFYSLSHQQPASS